MAKPSAGDASLAVTLRQLRAFLMTAQSGSASAAARALGISQPAVSQHLQELEKLLRVRLFERLGIRMLPTPAGIALIEPARHVLAGVGRVEPAIAPFRGAESGYVRIGTGATLCIHFLPQPIARAKARHGALQVLVVTGNVDELVAGVEAGELDVALVTTERLRLGPAFHVEPMFSEDFVAIAPVALAPTLPEALSGEDLMRHPLILFEPAGRTREIMDNWFASQGIRPVPTMELGSVEAIKTMVAAALGVSFVPSLALSTPDSRLVSRRLSPPLQRHLCLVVRADKVLDAGLRTFLGELRAAAAPLAPPA